MIPWRDIDTLFLDVGNTLISIDFEWVAAELIARGLPSTAEDLRRAEAGARPGYSHGLFVEGVPPGTDLFRHYLRTMLERAPAAASLTPVQLEALLDELRPALRPDGKASSLWKLVMPRVPDALSRLRAAGLRLVVVSNSDGTVAHSLEAAGLLQFMSVVIDSALVGYEKPDPRIFRAALERTGADANRTLHIGDLYHADVLGARGAGVRALLLDPYEDWTLDGVEKARDLWEVADRFAADRQRSG
jgi:putative hydrolase of the HAD superfamily